MNRVYKYPIEITDVQEIEFPLSFQPLTVQMQRNQLCLWAIVDPESETARYRIRVAGTGHGLSRICDAAHYIGTTQMLDGDLVWHVFGWWVGEDHP